MKIKVKYFTDKVQKLEKISKGNWIDLRASEDIEMKQGEFKLIPLGVAMQLPTGYEELPRSFRGAMRRMWFPEAPHSKTSG